MEKADIGMKVGDGAFFVLNNKYVFGGMSYGFKTIYQNVTYDIDAPFTDSYLFNYDPNDGVECFYSAELSRSSLMSSDVFQQFKGEEVQNKTTQNRDLF